MATATINWILPTTRTDATPLAPTDISGVSIMDSASPVPGGLIGTALGAATSFTTGALTPGPHTFDVVVNDVTGSSSVASAGVTVTVPPPPPPPAPPSPATGLAATLNP